MSEWVYELQPEPGLSIPPECSEWMLTLCRERLGEQPVQWAVAKAYENASKLIQEVPELGASEGWMRITRLGAEACMLHTLLALVDKRAQEWFPEDQTQVVQDLARRRFPLSRLLAGIRVAHASVSNAYLEVCAALAKPEQQVEELQRVSSTVMEIFDCLTAQTEIEYETECKKWFHSVNNVRRTELVKQLLNEPTSAVADLEHELGYFIEQRQHLGVVAWYQAGASDLAKLDLAVQEWLAQAGARYSLTISWGTTCIWGWGSIAKDTDPSECLGHGLELPGTRIAVGTWRQGLPGFRSTHREAVAAEDVAIMFPKVREDIIDYKNISLLTLAVSNLERAIDFSVSELGALSEMNQRSEELRETVKEYLELRSPKAVAERLFLARGTVTYRLRQAEELLGHSLESRATELRLAIELFESQVKPTGHV